LKIATLLGVFEGQFQDLQNCRTGKPKKTKKTRVKYSKIWCFSSQKQKNKKTPGETKKTKKNARRNLGVDPLVLVFWFF